LFFLILGIKHLEFIMRDSYFGGFITGYIFFISIEIYFILVYSTVYRVYISGIKKQVGRRLEM
jgi:hypothetical protein